MTQRTPATAWRSFLRSILRNTAPSSLLHWCKGAGISPAGTQALMAYPSGASASEVASAIGCEIRALSHLRLRALKQLRSYLVYHPELCPDFIRYLSENTPYPSGPLPLSGLKECLKNS